MAWETSDLFACADCPLTYRATMSIRKAAWHWLTRGHRPALSSPVAIAGGA